MKVCPGDEDSTDTSCEIWVKSPAKLASDIKTSKANPRRSSLSDYPRIGGTPRSASRVPDRYWQEQQAQRGAQNFPKSLHVFATPSRPTNVRMTGSKSRDLCRTIARMGSMACAEPHRNTPVCTPTQMKFTPVSRHRDFRTALADHPSKELSVFTPTPRSERQTYSKNLPTSERNHRPSRQHLSESQTVSSTSFDCILCCSDNNYQLSSLNLVDFVNDRSTSGLCSDHKRQIDQFSELRHIAAAKHWNCPRSAPNLPPPSPVKRSFPLRSSSTSPRDDLCSSEDGVLSTTFEESSDESVNARETQSYARNRNFARSSQKFLGQGSVYDFTESSPEREVSFWKTNTSMLAYSCLVEGIKIQDSVNRWEAKSLRKKEKEGEREALIEHVYVVCAYVSQCDALLCGMCVEYFQSMFYREGEEGREGEREREREREREKEGEIDQACLHVVCVHVSMWCMHMASCVECARKVFAGNFMWNVLLRHGCRSTYAYINTWFTFMITHSLSPSWGCASLSKLFQFSPCFMHSPSTWLCALTRSC